MYIYIYIYIHRYLNITIIYVSNLLNDFELLRQSLTDQLAADKGDMSEDLQFGFGYGI